MSYYMEGGDMDGLKRTGPGVLHVLDEYGIQRERMVSKLKSAKDETEYALRYLEYAISRADLGEDGNARLLTEVAERSFLRAFLYIRNALEDAKDNEKDS